MTVTGDASATILVSELANTSTTPVLPVLNLPASFTLLASGGQITLGADALGTTGPTDLRTVVLTASAGKLTADTLGSGVSAVVAGQQYTFGSAPAAASITLTGTVAALNSYLGTAGNLSFDGVAGTLPTLAVAVAMPDGSGGIVAQVQNLATLKVLSADSGFGTSPDSEPAAAGFASLVQSLPITPEVASTLLFKPNSTGVIPLSVPPEMAQRLARHFQLHWQDGKLKLGNTYAYGYNQYGKTLAQHNSKQQQHDTLLLTHGLLPQARRNLPCFQKMDEYLVSRLQV